VKKRNQLLKYCLKRGIEAKIHYPVPIYLQKALAFRGYKKGDFPVTDRHAAQVITFPCDQHLKRKQLNYIIKTVKNFYS
jgi:dTDP-4-amino-4,6-dideoxygalactose transaminase